MITPTAEQRAREMVARWEHGSEEHRQWLRDMCIPEITAALTAAEAEARRAAIEVAARIADDAVVLVTTNQPIKFTTPTKFAADLAKDIADGIRALASSPAAASPWRPIAEAAAYPFGWLRWRFSKSPRERLARAAGSVRATVARRWPISASRIPFPLTP